MGIKFNELTGSAVKNNVKYMKLADGMNTFRILPDSVLPGYTYWVKGANNKDLPFDALQFDRETEKFNNTLGCPVRDKGIKDKKGEEDLRCQWSYKCQVINKATGEVEVLQLKKGMLAEIISVAQQLGMDPTDLDTGTWLTVERKKTGPMVFNVEYKLQQLMCKASSLEDEFRAKLVDLKKITEIFPRETYTEQATRLDKHLSGEQEEQASDKTDTEAVDELNG